MRILELISSGGHYGAENMLLNLAQGLQEVGETVTVGVFQNSQNPNLEIADRLREAGIAVEIVPCRGRFDLRAVREVRRIMTQRKIEIVHSHGYKADLYSLAAAWRLRVPLVATCHNWPGKSIALRAYAALDRWALSSFARIGVVSGEVARLLERAGVKQDRIVPIPNGIDTRRFSSAQPARDIRMDSAGEIVIGVVGRLVREKGGEVLLRAIAEVAKEFATVRLIFVGEGPERDFLEECATKLGIGPAVMFAGHRSDMPEVYAAFDICVLPSFGEGMPMTVLEAMAAGRAMIATRVGEIPHVITDGENGLLVEPKDPGGLRDAIHKLLYDTELRQKLAKNGSRHIRDNFSFERMTQAYLEIYGGLAKATPSNMHTVGASNHHPPQSRHA